VQQYGAPTPYWPSSPSANFEDVPGSEKIGDMHYWAVWHALNPLEDYAKIFPRFMSEFGFQSFPEWRTIEAFTVPDDRGISTDVMHVHQKNVGGNERIRTYMLRDYKEPKDFASFLYVSQLLQAEGIKLGAEHLRRQRPRTMGSLYWQLNDCWPVASWASIDYYGRWKALHYYAKRFYNDLLVSPWEQEGKLNVYVVSDRLERTRADLVVSTSDFEGNELYRKTETIYVESLSSSVYFTATRADLLAGADPKSASLHTSLFVNGQMVSRNHFYFEKMKDSNLPEPKLTTDLSGANGEYTLKIGTDRFARGIYVSFTNSDAIFSDNYFDLPAGGSHMITIKSKASLHDLKSQLKLMTLVDTY
jgi:beta-mannosidase